MKDSYPKYIVNAVVIVLVVIIVAMTITLNYSSVDKIRADCYEKVYRGKLVLYTSEEYKKELTKEEAEGKAPRVAARMCLE